MFMGALLWDHRVTTRLYWALRVLYYTFRLHIPCDSLGVTRIGSNRLASLAYAGCRVTPRQFVTDAAGMEPPAHKTEPMCSHHPETTLWW